MILTPLQKLPKNGEDWGKLIVAQGFKSLPKVTNIAQSGHTGHVTCFYQLMWFISAQCSHVTLIRVVNDLGSRST